MTQIEEASPASATATQQEADARAAQGKEIEENGASWQPGSRSWADVVGPVVKLERVAEVLGVSADTLRRRAELGRLLILRTRRGTEVMPANHFLNSGVMPGLEGVLEALQETDWSLWSRAAWLVTPLGGLGGRTVIDWLSAGLGPEMPICIASARGKDE
jgi:hypothetical protein